MMSSTWTVNKYTVVLESVGDRRVEVMRAIRRFVTVEPRGVPALLTNLPQTILAEAEAQIAFSLAWQLFEAGADIRVIQHAREYPAACWAGDEGPEPISESVQEVPREWWVSFR